MQASEFKEAVETRIGQILEFEINNSPTSESQKMLQRIHQLVLRSGKRFRPQLLRATYLAYGGIDQAKLINLAACLELMHQGLLIHDDIMDNDDVRYDGPNISGYYKLDANLSDDTANSIALLAGDLVLSLCNKYLTDDQSLAPKVKLKVLQLVSQTMLGVIYGQQLDVLQGGRPNEEFSELQMEQIHYLKAALYTTVLPMRIAARVLNLKNKEIDLLDNFAAPFGIYFQLVDDYADYFVSHTAFDSRPKFRDYAKGKPTYPYLSGLKLAKQPQPNYLMSYFGHGQLSDKVKAKVVSILDECGARQAARLQSLSYYHQATNALKELSVTSEQKGLFQQLLDDIKI